MSRKYMADRKKRKSRTLLPFSIVSFIGIAMVIAILVIYRYYLKVFAPTTLVESTVEEYYLYIPTNTTYETLLFILTKDHVISDEASFNWLANKMNLPKHIHAGKYEIKKNLNNYDFIIQLRTGNTVDQKVTINQIYTIYDIASVAGNSLELDSAEFIKKVLDPEFLKEKGFTKETIVSLFLPDTYFFKWNTGVDGFIDRMETEYKKFWNENRQAKAKEINLSPLEVTTLAAIVQMEVMHGDEMPKVAGLYLNRLKRGMLLQADPTLKYAANDWTIRRVLDEHKLIESPYNTYIHAGLPPGPIIMPQKTAIDAVLNPISHNYTFMCAKADMSGYHEFSTNISQHNYYANLYRRELNKRKIYR